MRSFNQVLVLAPHIDDEIHCAGALHRLKSQGAEIHVFAGSLCTESIPDGIKGDPCAEFVASCKLLKADCSTGDWPVRRFNEHRQRILDHFVDLNKTLKPNLVFCPSSDDAHQDHAVVHQEARRAFRGTTLLGWESPNNQRVIHTDVFWTFDEDSLDCKIAIWNGYQTQHHRIYFNDDTIRGLATVRGNQCQSPTGLAESFEAIRVVF